MENHEVGEETMKESRKTNKEVTTTNMPFSLVLLLPRDT
jgi:hypothetical protein